MNKIRLVPVLAFALLIVLFSSCHNKKNDAPYGGTGNTDLEVFVLDSNQQLVVGAAVSLFKSKADRDAGTNAIHSDVTGSKGFAYFSKITPTVYYFSAMKNYNSTTKTGKGDTGVSIKESEQTAATVVLQ